MASVSTTNDLNCTALLKSGVHPALSGLDGSGVIICVIDYGFDLLHPAFRTRLGETRFAAVIDQNGCRLRRDEINVLLREVDRTGNRSTLDKVYDPHERYFGRSGVQVGAHGSWVASIAAGSRTAEFCGVAPSASLIGVQLDLPDHAWREEDSVGQPTWHKTAALGASALKGWAGWRSYEDSTALVSAINQSYEYALKLRPDGIVLNLSVGAWAGGHDNASAVNQAIERVIASGQSIRNPMVAVATGTGNAGADDGHASDWISSSDPARFDWSFAPQCSAQSKLEIWTDCPGGLVVELKSRSHGFAVRHLFDSAAQGTSAITQGDGTIVGIGENRGLVRGELSSVRMLLQPSLVIPAAMLSESCVFEVTVRPKINDCAGLMHAWLERDCVHGAVAKLTQTASKTISNAFIKRSKKAHDFQLSSLTALASCRSVISVAGLDGSAGQDAVLAMSGRGPRPWPSPLVDQVGAASMLGPAALHTGLPAPLLAAPASLLFGARSKSLGYMRGSGTSGASALVAGASALAIQAAVLAGRRLDRLSLVETLLGRTVDPKDHEKWRPDIGFGSLSFDASRLSSDPINPLQDLHSNTEVARDERTISSPN